MGYCKHDMKILVFTALLFKIFSCTHHRTEVRRHPHLERWEHPERYCTKIHLAGAEGVPAEAAQVIKW